MKQTLILASTSPYRAKLLEDAQIPFEAVAPELDEEAHKDGRLPARDLVEKLSRLKAQSLVGTFPQHYILGSDQALVFEGEFLNKPGSPEKNLELLLRLQGQTHQLITGLAIFAPGNLEPLYMEEIITLEMARLSKEELSQYVQRDRPWNCAGGYKYEASGRHLFKSVETADPLAIVGLPMEQLKNWYKKEFSPS